MSERAMIILELARNDLRESAQAAASGAVFSVYNVMIHASRELTAVVSELQSPQPDRDALRNAAHRALGAMEQVFGRLQYLRHPEAYQMLLDIAYR